MYAEETVILLKNGSEIKYGGAPGAFEREFVYMETILEEVRRIISGSNISVEGLENLMDKLQQLRYGLIAIIHHLYSALYGDLDLDSTGCIGPHSDAILICFELPPLLPPW